MTDDLGKDLETALAAWHGAYRRALEARGMTAGAPGALLAELTPTGLPQTALTARTGLSKQAVQQMLDRLEADGLIRREPDPADRRAKQVVLTEAGLARQQAQTELRAALNTALHGRLGKKLSAKLGKALRKIGKLAGR